MRNGRAADPGREIAQIALKNTGYQPAEMLARFVEQGGDASTAASIRANWSPAWGDDPGAPKATEEAA